MKLNAQQLAAFDGLGYVFMPNCFSEEEIALMRAEGEAILKSDRREVWREKTGATHRVRRPHVQRGFSPVGVPSAPG
jgi:ectoine hydroxylase